MSPTVLFYNNLGLAESPGLSFYQDSSSRWQPAQQCPQVLIFFIFLTVPSSQFSHYWVLINRRFTRLVRHWASLREMHLTLVMKSVLFTLLQGFLVLFLLQSAHPKVYYDYNYRVSHQPHHQPHRHVSQQESRQDTSSSLPGLSWIFPPAQEQHEQSYPSLEYYDVGNEFGERYKFHSIN